VRLLRADLRPAWGAPEPGVIEVSVPSILDHEVVAVELKER
jgi:hypothetical protein